MSVFLISWAVLGNHSAPGQRERETWRDWRRLVRGGDEERKKPDSRRGRMNEKGGQQVREEEDGREGMEYGGRGRVGA